MTDFSAGGLVPESGRFVLPPGSIVTPDPHVGEVVAKAIEEYRRQHPDENDLPEFPLM